VVNSRHLYRPALGTSRHLQVVRKSAMVLAGALAESKREEPDGTFGRFLVYWFYTNEAPLPPPPPVPPPPVPPSSG